MSLDELALWFEQEKRDRDVLGKFLDQAKKSPEVTGPLLAALLNR